MEVAMKCGVNCYEARQRSRCCLKEYGLSIAAVSLRCVRIGMRGANEIMAKQGAKFLVGRVKRGLRACAAGAAEGSGTFAGHFKLCTTFAPGETSKRRGAPGAGFWDGSKASTAGFRSAARGTAPGGPGDQPFARLGELRRQFALQAVDLAGKFGDLAPVSVFTASRRA